MGRITRRRIPPAPITETSVLVIADGTTKAAGYITIGELAAALAVSETGLTKEMVEAVLTGVITSHSHALTKSMIEAVLTGTLTSHNHAGTHPVMSALADRAAWEASAKTAGTLYVWPMGMAYGSTLVVGYVSPTISSASIAIVENLALSGGDWDGAVAMPSSLAGSATINLNKKCILTALLYGPELNASSEMTETTYANSITLDIDANGGGERTMYAELEDVDGQVINITITQPSA